MENLLRQWQDWSVKLFSELFAGEAFDDDAVKLTLG